MNKKILPFILSAVALTLAWPTVNAQAQSTESAVRETDILGRQQKEKVEQELRKPTAEKPEIEIPTIEEVKDERKFPIKKIELTGYESLPPEKFQSVIEKYENKEVSISDLKILAKQLEQVYLDHGIIAAVIVPPQEIVDTATLQIIEARFGELKIQDQKYFKKNRLKYYWKIPKGEVIHYEKISKSLQMMNKNPDREVKAALEAGAEPKTTDVVLTAKTSFPLHFTASFDNAGSTPTGKGRQGYGFKHNNFLGFDDTLIVGDTFGNHFDGWYAYHNIPISSNGTSLLYGYSHSESRPKKEFAINALNSFADNTSIAIYQDIYKKDENRGVAFVEFDAKDKTVKMNTGVYSRDCLRIFKFGSDFNFRGLGSLFNIAPELSQGVTAFGASSVGNPLASRGAKPNFTKFVLGMKYRKILPLNIQFNAKVKAQTCSTKLTPQEEFGLGGLDSVRGYPDSDYLADDAFIENLELVFPAFFIPQKIKMPFSDKTFRQNTSLVLFSDYGWGRRRSPLSSDQKSVNFLSAGPGLRINLFDKAMMRLEWGFQLGANRSITEKGTSQFHFSVDFQY